MKIALITDLHFGARNDNQGFANYFQRFYSQIFFPYLKEHNIDTVVYLGDTFDRRKFISFTSLKSAKEMFFEPLAENNIKLHVLVGNHDSVYKNTLELNSIDLLCSDYDNVIPYSSPTEVEIGGCDIMMVPWICADNSEQTFKLCEETKAQVLFGHLELANFEMNKGYYIREGHGVDWLKKFDIVYTGHYHTKSTQGNVTYLGTPYQMTWTDYEDTKGFHIFDTETRELEFIANPFDMFYKVWYNDTDWTMQDIIDQTDIISNYKGSCLKIIVSEKCHPELYDMYIDKIEKIGFLNIQVVDDHLHLDLQDDGELITEAEDTLTILDKYINGIETTADKEELRTLVKGLYSEALTIT